MKDLTNGAKATGIYLKSIGHKLDHSDAWCVTNIIDGHTVYNESMKRDLLTFFRPMAFKLSEIQIEALIAACRGGLGS